VGRHRVCSCVDASYCERAWNTHTRANHTPLFPTHHIPHTPHHTIILLSTFHSQHLADGKPGNSNAHTKTIGVGSCFLASHSVHRQHPSPGHHSPKHRGNPHYTTHSSQSYHHISVILFFSDNKIRKCMVLRRMCGCAKVGLGHCCQVGSM
jgi:hypothetical protein